MQECLYLGNLEARRDWGHARDYVEMQWLMLQQPEPDDYVIATCDQYSVRDFVDAAAAELDLRLTWRGEGAGAHAVDHTGKTVVAVDPRYFRPTEVETLLGDARKAREKLGWSPKTPFRQLVAEMAREDLTLCERDAVSMRHGFKVARQRE
jgi:GDPmannose 4,6-dehydratase